MLVVGLFVEREIEQGVVSRLGEVQSLYVDSLVAPHVESCSTARPPRRRTARRARRAARRHAARPEDRRVHHLASRRPRAVQQRAPRSSADLSDRAKGFATALAGDIYAEVIDRRASHEHALRRRHWPERLIETYAPMHARGAGQGARRGRVLPDDRRARRAMRRRAAAQLAASSSATMLACTCCCSGSCAAAADDRRRSGRSCATASRELSALLAANAQLDANVRARRRAHDRAQRALPAAHRRRPARRPGAGPRVRADAARVDDRRRSAGRGRAAATARTRRPRTPCARPSTPRWRTCASISADMQLPEIEQLSPCRGRGARRARLRAQDRRAGGTGRPAGEPVDAALPVKITLVPRAAGARSRTASATPAARASTSRVVQTRDSVIARSRATAAPASTPSRMPPRGRGGLAGMRERVQALGGTFDVRTRARRGHRGARRLAARASPGATDD